MPHFGACGRNQYSRDTRPTIEEIRQAVADVDKFVGRMDPLLNTPRQLFSGDLINSLIFYLATGRNNRPKPRDGSIRKKMSLAGSGTGKRPVITGRKAGDSPR